MLVTARLECRAFVDALIPVDEVPVFLVHEVIKRADERAYKVREESVHVRVVETDDPRPGVLYAAVWSPRKARFVGGEYDGDVQPVARSVEFGGFPPDVWRLPYRHVEHVVGIGREDGWDPRPTRHPEYRRAGIDPIEDVWVYRMV